MIKMSASEFAWSQGWKLPLVSSLLCAFPSEMQCFHKGKSSAVHKYIFLPLYFSEWLQNGISLTHELIDVGELASCLKMEDDLSDFTKINLIYNIVPYVIKARKRHITPFREF